MKAFGVGVHVTGVEQSNQAATNTVEIVLDSSGLVLKIAAANGGHRLVSDVCHGASLQTHIHPDDYQGFLWSTQGILNGTSRQQTIQVRWARSNGRWSKVNIELSGVDSETVLLAFRHDEVEHARRAEAQFRRIVEGASAYGIVVRNNAEVLYQNDAFAHLLGYSSTREMAAIADIETKAGRNQNSSAATHPDDRALLAEHMRRRIAGEETVSDVEFRLLSRSGDVVWVHARTPLVDWNGQRALLSWLSDITRRKGVEAELIESQRAAESANRIKTEFLANMSHELRTPLNAIIGFSEVIKDELFGPGRNKYTEYAGDIHGSGRHLLDLINDILDLSKLESGKLELREEDVAPEAVIRDCLNLVRAQAEKGQIAFAVDVEPGLPKLTCDERSLKQVLLNLMSNAVKFTPAGGTVTAGARRCGLGMAVWVRDTGIGMKEADIQGALMAFRQIDSKIARKHRGTGLGLSISKSLVELHGGTLEVKSAPGQGTTMTAIFPASRVKALAA